MQLTINDLDRGPVATSFCEDIEQMITLRDVEALGDLADRIRTPRIQLIPIAASSPPEPVIGDQLK